MPGKLTRREREVTDGIDDEKRGDSTTLPSRTDIGSINEATDAAERTKKLRLPRSRHRH